MLPPMNQDTEPTLGRAPPPALFVHEDFSRPENRTNLALLGILTIPAFRYWFLGRLGLPSDSIVYPPQILPGSVLILSLWNLSQAAATVK